MGSITYRRPLLPSVWMNRIPQESVTSRKQKDKGADFVEGFSISWSAQAEVGCALEPVILLL
ncbi:hypothetical protein [Thermogutta terrifontis]|uniref:hypothetical protein n=1 Tax=Thermogutta terrifontis TaxID=1331910 RepID=UPI001A9A3D14|nr:hypothetical protein [Thermogutta terrifontis]